MPHPYPLALYLLVLAGLQLFINLKTPRSNFAKTVTYLGMWAAIIASVSIVLMSLR